MGRTKGTKNTVFHKYTEEQKQFIRENVKGTGNNELTQAFNEKFGIELKITQIKCFKKNNKLTSGLDGQFKKGCISFNKGMKGVCAKGSEKGWFKKGNIPINHRPIGSERVSVDGYTEVKVSELNKWKLKQRKQYWKELHV